MKTHPSMMIIAVLALALGLPQRSQAQPKDNVSEEKIGIYDSRAVAVAYAGSPTHEKWLATMKAERAKAKESGDDAAVVRIETEAKAQQAQMHQQAFSTASVADLLAEIPAEVERIRNTEGLVAMISRWDEAELNKHGKAGRIDVTPAIIDAFHPTERQRARALEIQKHKRVTPEQARGDPKG